MTRWRRAAATTAAAGFAVAAAAAAAAAPDADCERIAPGAQLRERIAEAPPGSALCLDAGVHEGPLNIDRPLALRGGPDAVVHSSGRGSTISVAADGVTLEGFRIDGSGGRFDLLDAAVRIGADDARVEGLEIRNALFGILAERCERPVIRANRIVGSPDRALGLRGDAIRLWEVRGARVEDNRVDDSRDLVVWYSDDNAFVRNRIRGGRYGTHFMYSHRNRLIGNRYVENVVGIFAMYSRALEIRGNLIARSAGAAGMGIGSKESGNLVAVDNWLVSNTVGVYLDNSPLYPDETNRFEGNAIRFGEVGVIFHGPAQRNVFHANRFADLGVPVRVEGRGSALDAQWRGNDFDDYAGYDLDGDGTGDVPFVLRDLEEDLAARTPAIRFFRGTPALGLVDWIGRVVPLFQPTVLLEDPAPALRLDDPPLPGGAGAG